MERVNIAEGRDAMAGAEIVAGMVAGAGIMGGMLSVSGRLLTRFDFALRF